VIDGVESTGVRSTPLRERQHSEEQEPMGKLISDISVSLDGYIAGPNDRPEAPLGEGGEVLHEWYFREQLGPDGRPTRAFDEAMDQVRTSTGALLMGRRSYDIAEGWGDEPPFHMPIFVLTHRAHPTVTRKGGTTFTFVTDGLESGVRQALAAAGDRAVGVHGGGATRQCLRAGLLDELILHVVPVLLGAGNRFFEEGEPNRVDLEPLSVHETLGVTHLRYRVRK
jgi:dihydrofolate reductase